jgi:diguanylate cyclase (GGDEF)-like protein
VDAATLLIQVNRFLTEDALVSGREVFILENELTRMHAKCENLSDSMNEYQRESETDDLTGLSLRTSLERYLDNASWKVRNKETNLGIIFLDVDNFKSTNDNHSHAAGDRLLQILAGSLQDTFGSLGCVCRFGGDEFVVAFMELDLKQAISLAQGLTNNIRQMKLPVRSADGQQDISFSCSVGLLFCEAGAHLGSYTQILELADSQMYAVKNNGKNNMGYQVVPANSSPIQPRNNTDAPLPTNR